jgi:hypothetical protein
MSEKFISGIYNYCDRWCERCSFTSRCRNYERTDDLSPEQQDINNNRFWEDIAANFEQAVIMIRDAAKERGIDIDAAMAEMDNEAYEQREAAIRGQ